MLVLQRDRDGNVTAMLEADHATWEPAGANQAVGRWRLDRGRITRRVQMADSGFGPTSGKETRVEYYYESELGPDAIEIRQSEGWIRFLSLSQLANLLDRPGQNTTEIVQTIHARRVTPIIGIVMLLLGLPFFLDRSPSNILTDAGKCMVVSGLCYVSSFVAQSLRPETTSAWPSWIPIFIFGTLAIVLVDRIRT